jgi:nicotinate-nucleotide pyrophosphorylase
MDKILPQIDFSRVDILIKLALEEDLNGRGDTTSNSVIPENTMAAALLNCKEECVCAGLE